MEATLDLVTRLKAVQLKELLEHMRQEDRPKFGGRWVLRNEIAPSDLYCYLGARFGVPNGLQNLLRGDHSDNLIHWEWTLRIDQELISFQGMNFRTEVIYTGNIFSNEIEKLKFIELIKSDFSHYGKEMSEIRKSLEHWTEFVNPYQRIKKSVEKLLNEIRELDLMSEDEAIPDITCAEQVSENLWGELAGKYSRGLGLCFGVRSMLPVMAEAFINLVLFLLMKPEIKSDERLRENTIRQPIDIRIKSLHLTCIGFEKPADYSHECCKAYHTLVNERNDLLHGNVVLDKLKFNDLYFNGKVPVFKKYRSMWERSVGVEIHAVGLHRLEKEVEIVEKFTAYIQSLMKENIREMFEIMARTRDLGLNSENGRVGKLFPGHLVDFFPVFSEVEKSDA